MLLVERVAMTQLFTSHFHPLTQALTLIPEYLHNAFLG